MIGRIATIVIVSLAAWLAAVLVAPALGFGAPYVVSVTALVVCLAPAVATLVLAEKARRWPPETQFTVLMGCTGIRMLAVLVAAIALSRGVPALAMETGFIGWVIAFYLVTLGVEAYLLVRSYSAPAGPTQQAKG